MELAKRHKHVCRSREYEERVVDPKTESGEHWVRGCIVNFQTTKIMQKAGEYSKMTYTGSRRVRWKKKHLSNNNKEQCGGEYIQ